MGEQGQEEFRVLFAAAEKGRADIINASVEALKKSGLISAEEEGDGITDNNNVLLAGSSASDNREAVISRLRESDGASPLHLASKNGHVDATRALLRLGAYPQVVGSGPLAGKTPWDVANAVVKQVYVNELFSQVAQGNASRVLALLKAGVASSVCEGVPRGDTPLHWAASYGHVKLCALLLSEGAELNHRNDEGATPLHEASRGGYASVVRYLLERGADAQIVGSGGAFEGKNPIQMSLTEAVFEVFRSNPPPFEPPQQSLRSIDVLSQGGLMEDRSLVGSSTIFVGKHQPEVESFRGSFDEKSDTTASVSNGIGDFSGQMAACNGHAGSGSTSQAKEDIAMENTALRARLGPPSAEEIGSSGLSRTPVEESRSCLDSEELLWRESLSRTPDLSYTGVEYGNERKCDGADGVEVHSNGGPVGGYIDEKYYRSLPMLWPPPRACTVLRSEVCRVPPKVTLVLPMNGIAGPGTHTLEILLEALTSKGVTATCTRGACPSVGENTFVVYLACGRLQRACAMTASTAVAFGGQGYSLMATEGMIRVTGTGEAGLYYGVSTLCQILGFYAHQSHIGAEKVAVEIPCCIIKDEPDVARRSLVLDLRYPLVPTMASMMRTLEAASQARLNVVQLTVTLETASWMLAEDQRDTNESNTATGTPNPSGRKEGEKVPGEGIKKWGWGALGKLEAFCERRFVDLVLGWAIVPGDESRDAQRKMMHLLPVLSRQFKSDEMHIAFDEGVRLTWGEHAEEEASESATNRDLGVGDRLTSDVDRRQTGALSPYRLLNNLVASCNKSTIVLEGVHPSAIASLQRVGCPPVELAFTVAAEVLSDNRALGAFSGDSIVDVVPDGLSMLLGPASVGYVSTALSGAGAGRREQACLSVHRALVDVASGAAEARHTGCGVQIRPRPIPASYFTPLPHSEHAAPLHPMSAATELPACGGINPYFPTLLSDIVVFFGAGLCWGLEKTHSAANLPMVAGNVPRGARAALGRGRFESTPGRGANGAAMGTDVQALHGSPRPALLLAEHVLEIDSGTIPPASMSQLCDCLEMLMEDWNPFMSNSLGLRFPPLALGGRQEEETDLLQKVDDVIWGMHAPGRKDRLNFVLSADNRFILKALQIRHLDIQAASKLVTTNLNALKGPSAETVLALFFEIARTARLLKLSGRLLQTIFFHVLGPDVRGSSKNRILRNSYPPSPPVMPSPRSGRRRSDQNGQVTRPIQNWPHSTGSYVYSESASGEENALPEWVKRLPLLARMDATNRYLDEIGALSQAWDSETLLPSGRAVLHASLLGLLDLLAHDMPVAEVKTLCKRAIYK